LKSIVVNEVSLKVLEHHCISLYKNGGQNAEQETQKLKVEIHKNKEHLQSAQQLL